MALERRQGAAVVHCVVGEDVIEDLVHRDALLVLPPELPPSDLSQALLEELDRGLARARVAALAALLPLHVVGNPEDVMALEDAPESGHRVAHVSLRVPLLRIRKAE